MEITAETISAIQLFSDLRLHERKLVADKCRELRFDAANIITSHRDTDSDVYFILSGVVRVIVYSISGKETAFRDLRAGEMFGEIAALDGRPRSAQVIALSETRLVAISADNFQYVLQLYPTVMARALASLARMVRLLSERVIEFNCLNVRDRLHSELLRLARQNMAASNQAEINPAPRHFEIANRISTHREAITRELNELASSGLVRKINNRLIIKDVGKLENMVQEVAEVYEK